MQTNQSQSQEIQAGGRFDVVVVGADRWCRGRRPPVGTSDTSVLLLEAGPDNTSENSAGIRARNWFKAYDEPGRLWPNLVAMRAAGQREAFYRRGRGIGGSSAVNAMGGIRGTPDDYQRSVASSTATAGVGLMLATFCSIENDSLITGATSATDRAGRSPWPGCRSIELAPMDTAVRAALSELGYPDPDDYHTPDAAGVSRWAFTWRDGVRVSTKQYYLEPARRARQPDHPRERPRRQRPAGWPPGGGGADCVRRGDRGRRGRAQCGSHPLTADPSAVRNR